MRQRGPNGGKRPGAGRPEGSTNTLRQGEVSALKALRLRVPKDASPEAADLAGEALEHIVAVMRGEVEASAAFAVLGAARTVREEVCGPVKQKVEVGGEGGGPLTIRIISEAGDSGA